MVFNKLHFRRSSRTFLFLFVLMLVIVVTTVATFTTLVRVPLTLDNTAVLDDVPGDNNAQSGWSDSYSVGDRCYCATTYDHDIGTKVVVVVPSTGENKTVKEICEFLGPGPGIKGRPIYNTIQCGHTPTNGLNDESDCPGRVDHGIEGCKYIGPKWKLNVTSSPTPSPGAGGQSMWELLLKFILRLFSPTK